MNVLLVGGGTAGSVTPLLAVAEQIRKRQPDTTFLFLGTAHGPETTLVPTAHIPFQSIAAGKLRRYWSWSNFTDLIRTVVGVVQSWRLMRQWRPDVVIGAGSYVCVPVCFAARMHRIPIMVHQQDVISGLANRIIAPWASKITVTFAASAKSFPKSKVEVTGNPVRQAISRSDTRKGRSFLGIAPERQIILCIGGGTGAVALNTLVSAAAPEILSVADVVHLTGGRATRSVEDPRYHPFEFLNQELPDVLAAASVVVTRAGLGMLSELGCLGKPAIVIPMPQTHQEANANILKEHQAAIVVDQRTMTPHQFASIIVSVLEDHQQRTALGTALHKIFTPGASERLAEMVLSYDPQRLH